MGRCPDCQKEYFDESLVFCLDDGARLVSDSGEIREAATEILSAGPVSKESPTRRITSADQPGPFGRSKLFAGAAIAVIALGAVAYLVLGGKRTQSIEQTV